MDFDHLHSMRFLGGWVIITSYVVIDVLGLLGFLFWLQQLYGFEYYVLHRTAVLGQSVVVGGSVGGFVDDSWMGV